MEVALGVPKYGILNIYSFFCSMSELDKTIHYFLYMSFFNIPNLSFLLTWWNVIWKGISILLIFLALCVIIRNIDQKLHLLILKNIID